MAEELVEIGWQVIRELAAGQKVKEGIGTSEWEEVVDSAWNPGDYMSITKSNSSPGSEFAVHVTLLKQGNGLLPPLSREEQGVAVQLSCGRWVADLLRLEAATHLTIALQILIAPLQEAVELLDPLRLRPYLLRTRCDLCTV